MDYYLVLTTTDSFPSISGSFDVIPAYEVFLSNIYR